MKQTAEHLRIKPDAIKLENNFAELGADYLDLLEITVACERELGISISEDALAWAAKTDRDDSIADKLTLAQFTVVSTNSPVRKMGLGERRASISCWKPNSNEMVESVVDRCWRLKNDQIPDLKMIAASRCKHATIAVWVGLLVLAGLSVPVVKFLVTLPPIPEVGEDVPVICMFYIFLSGAWLAALGYGYAWISQWRRCARELPVQEALLERIETRREESRERQRRAKWLKSHESECAEFMRNQYPEQSSSSLCAQVMRALKVVPDRGEEEYNRSQAFYTDYRARMNLGEILRRDANNWKTFSSDDIEFMMSDPEVLEVNRTDATNTRRQKIWRIEDDLFVVEYCHHYDPD